MTKHRLFRSLLLVIVTLSFFIGMIFPAAAVMVKKPLDGKTISILGDSISTFANVSCADASLTSNSTIKNNRLYFTDGRLGVSINDTWWKQAIDKLGGEILVNNSYSNSMVFDPVDNAHSQAYLDRCVNLHDNTGENSGEEPDIIIVYMGINDFSYHKTQLGSYSDINFNALISSNADKTTYAQPTTSCEAYAIMLHKIKTRYPDAEVFCFNFPAKKTTTPEDVPIFNNYNKSIELICDYFGCNLVDLHASFNDASESNETFFYDGIHPNKNGMDVITNAFIESFYKYSIYSDTSIPSYNIEYNLNNVIASNGNRYSVKETDDFYCKLETKDNSPIQVSVTMNDIDVTKNYVNKNFICIPSVTGNLVISATNTNFIADSYGFTVENDALSSTDNDGFVFGKTTIINGTIENKVISNGLIEFEKTIELKKSEPWSLVWNASYSSDRKSHVFSFNNYASINEEGNQFIKLDTAKETITIGKYTNGETHSFGIDLSSYNVDYNENHTYKLHNNVNDGNVYLYIDGKKIDTLSSYYVNDQLQKTSYNNFQISDILLNYMGSEENHIFNTTIEYIKIWESIVPETHVHNHEYNCVYELTCTEDERTEKACDCGDTISEITAVAEGHKESPWLTSKVATVNSSGSAYKICETCGKLLQSKVLPQLKPATPKIYSISNKINGIKIDWYNINGADSYRVYRRGAGEGYWTYIATVTTNSYLDTTAKNNAYWRYTVRAGNEAGYGGYDNNGKYIKYVSAPHISKLENLTNGIQITWNKIPGATGYRVYRNRLGYSNWTYVGTTTANKYIDKNIVNANGVYYKYTIRAVNSYYSDFEVNTQYIKRLCTPKLLSAKSYNNGIELKWMPVVGTTGYYVYRKTDKSGWVCIDSVGGTNNTVYIDQTAKKGVKYTYTVKACYGKHLSSYNSKGVSAKR